MFEVLVFVWYDHRGGSYAFREKCAKLLFSYYYFFSLPKSPLAPSATIFFVYFIIAVAFFPFLVLFHSPRGRYTLFGKCSTHFSYYDFLLAIAFLLF